MKKNIFVFAAALSILVVGCQKMPENGQGASSADLSNAPEVIYAETEGADTKITLGPGETNYRVLWEAGEQIALYTPDGTVLRYNNKSDETSAGTTEASFTNESWATPGKCERLSSYVALYPLTSGTGVSNMSATEEDGVFYISHDPEFAPFASPMYAEGKFAVRSFPMIAVSSDGKDFKFKNVFGGLHLKVKGSGSLTKVAVKGGNSEKLVPNAGKYKYIASADAEPQIQIEEGGNEIVLRKDWYNTPIAELTSKPLDLYISVPPTKFENGFTVTLTNDDGISKTLKSKTGSEIKRSVLLSMPEVDFTVVDLLGKIQAVEGQSTYDAETGKYTLGDGGYISIPLDGVEFGAKSDLVVSVYSSFNFKFVLVQGNTTLESWSCGSPGKGDSGLTENKNYDFGKQGRLSKRSDATELRIYSNGLANGATAAEVKFVKFITY